VAPSPPIEPSNKKVRTDKDDVMDAEVGTASPGLLPGTFVNPETGIVYETRRKTPRASAAKAKYDIVQSDLPPNTPTPRESNSNGIAAQKPVDTGGQVRGQALLESLEQHNGGGG
jgi:hypothetical protein